MLKDTVVNIFWFRRDLRLNDNHGLYEALNSGLPVLCLFIFDSTILSRIENPRDPRVSFIYQKIKELKIDLEKSGSSLLALHGKPVEVFRKLLETYALKDVYCNEDYEPEAIKRDDEIKTLLADKGINFYAFKDQVIFSKHEVIKPNGKPYTIFTPYSKRWLALAGEQPGTFEPYLSERSLKNLAKTNPLTLNTLEEIGFNSVDPGVIPLQLDAATLDNYGERRDMLFLNGTSHAGVHLRFGTISIRSLALKGLKHSRVFLSELIWRDFFQSILFHFPHVGLGLSFKPAYDFIPWRNDESEFHKWCEGKTGYPVVDAGMRELCQTGFMHNRARMITASFLCKHLLIDWRWGEAWFAEKLLDFDLAANNGGWQWAAGSGCDAAPYFRIFNPYTQAKKFDPDNLYIKRWVPEFGTDRYPLPIVEHELARKRCLEIYGTALRKQNR